MATETQGATDGTMSGILARSEEYIRRLSSFRGMDGRVLVDMRYLWCGWLYFGFSGDLSKPKGHLGQATCENVTGDIDGHPGILVETAYCSSVFRDLCEDLMKSSGNASPQEIHIFCEAEEHGNYEVRMGADKVSVWDYDDTDTQCEVCSVSRSDGGSYIEDCLGTIASIASDIVAKEEGDRRSILGSLALFCEKVEYDDDDDPYATDATPEDVNELLRGILLFQKV